MHTTVKIISGISILLLLGGWVVYKLNANGRIAQVEIQEELKAIGYNADATTVWMMDFSGGFEYRGTIEAGKIINLAAEADGKIIYSTVRKGIRVTRGLLLVRIDGSIRQSNYQISQDNYSKAQSDYTKLKGLLAADNATGEKVENAKLLMKNAASQLSIAKKQVSQTSVIAPDDGIIIDKKINEGEYVQTGSPLCTLAPDPMSFLLQPTMNTHSGHSR